MLGHSLALATFLSIAFAFSDTVPIVAWSSHKSSALDVLPSAHKTSPRTGAVFESILFDDDACSNDAIVLVDQPGLYASDLRTLSPSSPLTTLLRNSPSSVQLPYVKRAEGAPSIQEVAELVSKRCGSRVLNFMAGQGGITYEKGSKHVMCVSMPHLEGDASERRDAMAAYESTLAQELSSIADLFPKHLVIFAGSAPHTFDRRQSELDSPAPAAPLLDLQQQPGNTTLAEGGILKRYQLLTPALITSLLIAFFVLVPIVFFGVSALASIQSPLRIEAPKGFSSQEKKTQ